MKRPCWILFVFLGIYLSPCKDVAGAGVDMISGSSLRTKKLFEQSYGKKWFEATDKERQAFVAALQEQREKERKLLLEEQKRDEELKKIKVQHKETSSQEEGKKLAKEEEQRKEKKKREKFLNGPKKMVEEFKSIQEGFAMKPQTEEEKKRRPKSSFPLPPSF